MGSKPVEDKQSSDIRDLDLWLKNNYSHVGFKIHKSQKKSGNRGTEYGIKVYGNNKNTNNNIGLYSTKIGEKMVYS